MTTSTTTATPLPLDWAGLRARYKEIQAQTKGQFQNWQIRVHRSLSWLKRAGELGPERKIWLAS